jgi:cytoplasmic tRNA 2-thiolation protein 2
MEKRKGAKDAIWERGTVVYVEFCGVIDGAEDRTSEVKKLAEARGLDFIGLRAEDVFDPSLSQRLGQPERSGQKLFADLAHPGESLAW